MQNKILKHTFAKSAHLSKNKFIHVIVDKNQMSSFFIFFSAY